MIQLELTGTILCGLAAIALGGMSILIKKAIKGGSIKELLQVNILINISFFSIIALILNYPFSITKALWTFIASGILATLGFRLLFYKGIKGIGASRATAIKTSTPIFASILSVIFLGESLIPLHMVGIALVIAGILFISWEMESEEKKGSIKYILMVVFGSFLLGAEAPISKYGYEQGVPIFLGLLVKVTTALIGILLIMKLKGKSLLDGLKSPNKKWYIYVGLANTLGISLFYIGLSITRVSVATPIANSAPLFTLIFSYSLTPELEEITWKTVAGALLVVVGAFTIGVFM